MRRYSSPLSVGIAVAALALALHAGPLDPPAGPIAPTYKTLAEVEPRTVINSTNTPGDAGNMFIITQPGSYCLAGNITASAGYTGNGIRITTSHVSLDLRGFSLTGVATSSIGILIVGVGLTDVSIQNGEIRSWGQSGVNSFSNVVKRMTVRNLTVSACGNNGLFLAVDDLIEDCTCSSNTGSGFVGSGTLVRCIATSNTGAGFSLSSGTTVSDCAASGNAGGYALGSGCTLSNCSAVSNTLTGFAAGSGNSFQNCKSFSNSGATSDGFSAGEMCTFTGCTATSNGRDGFVVTNRCTLTRCDGITNARNQFSGADANVFLDNTAGMFNGISTGAGFTVSGSRNRVEGNTATSQTNGYAAPMVGNIFVRNAASGNTNAFTAVNGGNIIGTVVNSSATLNGATNSLVNITY